MGNLSGSKPSVEVEDVKKKEEIIPKNFVPKILSENKSTLLSQEQMNTLSKQLPSREKGLDWILLFSNANDGKSFSILYKKIFLRGPTLFVMQTKESSSTGHVFGFFASHGWKKQPDFFGDDNSFFFTINKSSVCKKYSSQGRLNNNFQYINKKKGIALGGKKKFFAFHIRRDLEVVKCNPKTSTFPYLKDDICDPKSSSSGTIERGLDFEHHIETLEVFGFPMTETMKLNLKYEMQLKKGKEKDVLGEEGNPDMFIMKTSGVMKDNPKRD